MKKILFCLVCLLVIVSCTQSTITPSLKRPVFGDDYIQLEYINADGSVEFSEKIVVEQK